MSSTILIHHRVNREDTEKKILRAKGSRAKAESREQFVYLEQQKKLASHVRAFLREKYQIELANMVIEQPPKVEMGEFALPLSFELAKRLRKASAQNRRGDCRRIASARWIRET